jgi:hypothetical protein
MAEKGHTIMTDQRMTGLEAYPELRRHIRRIQRSQGEKGQIRDDKLRQFSPTFFQEQMGGKPSTVILMRHDTDIWIQELLQKRLGSYWQFNSTLMPYIVAQNYFQDRQKRKQSSLDFINQGQHIWIPRPVAEIQEILADLTGRTLYGIQDIPTGYRQIERLGHLQSQTYRWFDSERRAQFELDLHLKHYRDLADKQKLLDTIRTGRAVSPNQQRYLDAQRVHQVTLPQDWEAYDLDHFITAMARFFLPLYSDQIGKKALQEVAESGITKESGRYGFLKRDYWQYWQLQAVLRGCERNRKRLIQQHREAFQQYLRTYKKV